MTTALDQPTTTDAADPTRRTARTLTVLAGGALVAGPLLYLGGMLTAPQQASDGTADYVASLARDTTLTEVSGILLHYANLLTGAGLFVLPLLVRGVRGRLLTLAGTLLAALTMLNISGSVKDDWWRMVIGQQLPLDVAVRISDTVDASTLLGLWRGTDALGFLGLLLLYLGLARAGVLGWWAPAVYVLAAVAMVAVPFSWGVVAGLPFALLFAPLAVAGVRAVRRGRL
ncbi:hypothetical protein [Spirilliplanes yamanashiensis]|uniref:DUF4386 family protein n=1 Tax=Spirilliplanes yamanashiensis TaxID=42233 RepID=A0A8J3YB02_9ACTN|nr:hypothetical protein [Spirilliplanes yamanashiensis]MDP9818906.1 hypothetical protein [Spirilliplanes yamanashiensis]GIJ05361.1 hypothetical protein Sya03_47130 [Spirilliplanes yamanashiensis]